MNDIKQNCIWISSFIPSRCWVLGIHRRGSSLRGETCSNKGSSKTSCEIRGTNQGIILTSDAWGFWGGKCFFYGDFWWHPDPPILWLVTLLSPGVISREGGVYGVLQPRSHSCGTRQLGWRAELCDLLAVSPLVCNLISLGFTFPIWKMERKYLTLRVDMKIT